MGYINCQRNVSRRSVQNRAQFEETMNYEGKLFDQTTFPDLHWSEFSLTNSNSLLNRSQCSVRIPNCGSEPPEIIFKTNAGLLIHFCGRKILRCLDLEEHSPGNGKVRKLEYFLTTSGRACLAVLQDHVLAIFELSDAAFVLRHQESSTGKTQIYAFDFLRKGTQQLHVKVIFEGRFFSKAN